MDGSMDFPLWMRDKERNGSTAGRKDQVERRAFILEQGLPLAWAIALTATAGSLYFSEVEGYIPCELCWYQRILMYPLVLLLGIAAVRKDGTITVYALPMSVIGFLVSSYHYLLQKTDWFDGTGAKACSIIPCDTVYINWLGFITIPFLAGTAFLLITVVLVLVRRAARAA